MIRWVLHSHLVGRQFEQIDACRRRGKPGDVVGAGTDAEEGLCYTNEVRRRANDVREERERAPSSLKPSIGGRGHEVTNWWDRQRVRRCLALSEWNRKCGKRTLTSCRLCSGVNPLTTDQKARSVCSDRPAHTLLARRSSMSIWSAYAVVCERGGVGGSSYIETMGLHRCRHRRQASEARAS